VGPAWAKSRARARKFGPKEQNFGPIRPRPFEEIKAGTISANDAYKQVLASRKSDDDAKPRAPKMVTLVTHEGTEVPYAAASKPTFNRTNEQISWAAWSWNPVTGCLHGCRYCYARELALRPKYQDFYPVGFTPLFHHERLSAPANSIVPDEAKSDRRLGRCGSIRHMAPSGRLRRQTVGGTEAGDKEAAVLNATIVAIPDISTAPNPPRQNHASNEGCSQEFPRDSNCEQSNQRTL
jgi:hypothetical protein